jgi:hypothetical protein
MGRVLIMTNLHKAVRGATLQHQGLFNRMALGGQWNLYYFHGALNEVAIFEVSEPGCPKYPPMVRNVHCMTGATLVTKLATLWEETERANGQEWAA